MALAALNIVCAKGSAKDVSYEKSFETILMMMHRLRVSQTKNNCVCLRPHDGSENLYGLLIVLSIINKIVVIFYHG